MKLRTVLEKARKENMLLLSNLFTSIIILVIINTHLIVESKFIGIISDFVANNKKTTYIVCYLVAIISIVLSKVELLIELEKREYRVSFIGFVARQLLVFVVLFIAWLILKEKINILEYIL